MAWIPNRNTLLATAATAAAVIALLRVRSPWRVPTAIVLGGVAAACREAGVVAFVLIALRLGLEARGAADDTRI